LILALGACLAGAQAVAESPSPASPAPVSETEAPEAQVSEATGAVISLLRGELPGIRERLAEAEAAPEFSRFKRDKADIQEDLDALLDEILAAVVGDLYRSKREEVLARDERLNALNTELADLIDQREEAQPSPAELSMVDRTLGRQYASGSREDIDRQIEAVKAELRKEEAANRAVFAGLARELGVRYQIGISADQARSLLYQLNGSSIVEAKVAYVVLNDIEKRLAASRAEAPNDEVMRRYYGMAAALRLVVVRLHEAHLLRYEAEWLPRLVELEASQQALIDKTEEEIQNEEAPERRAHYENNLALQRTIMEVATDYRERLLRQQETVRLRLEGARADARVAINTLQTLESAKILSGEIASSSEEYQALLEINTSDLIPLTENDLDDPYLDLSRRLASS
jgi:hypothetical protein